MRIFKPQCLSVLQRAFEREHNAYLGVAVIAFVPLGAEPALHSEQELWPFVAPLMDPQVPLDVALPKTGAEFLVVGDVHAPGGEPASGLEVEARVGALRKVIHAYGRREWRDGRPGEAELFAQLPCGWAAAYGGPDFPDNPRGLGRSAVDTPAGKRWPIPHLEYPTAPFVRPDRPIAPACFAPIPLTWPARSQFDGTYDEAWLKNEYPGPPHDLDWRVHCIAPADQWQPTPFVGTEPVQLGHWHPDQPWIEAALPGIRPVVAIRDRGSATAQARFGEPRLTTVWLFPNQLRMALVWHAVFPVEDELGDSVELLLAAAEWLDRPLPRQHYLEAIDARLDPKHGALKLLADEELLPAGLATPNEALARHQELLGTADLAEHIDRRLREAAETRRQRLTATLGAEGLARAEADALAALRRVGLPPPPQRLPSDPVGLQRIAAELARTLPTPEAVRPLADAEAAALRGSLRAQLEAAGHPAERIEALVNPVAARDRIASPAALATHFETLLGDLPRKAGEAAPALDPRLKAIAAEAAALHGAAAGATAHLEDPPPARDPETLARWRDGALRARAQGRSFAGLRLQRADLSGLDLSGTDFTGADLGGASFKGAKLAGARFDQASLAHAILDGAELDGASFAAANLGRAHLAGASARRCDFSGAILEQGVLSGADFQGATFGKAMLREVRADRAQFTDADLSQATFLKCQLAEATFGGARLERALFLECEMPAAAFEAALLPRATFVTCMLDGARFDRCTAASACFVHGTSLRGASFAAAQAPQANLRGMPLDAADFSAACLDGADLSGAACPQAQFARASLRGALLMKGRFEGAAFTGANLMHAILQHADLRAVDLRGANLYAADLMRVLTDAGTSAEGALLAKARTQPQRRARGPGPVEAAP